jgi:acyl carrier protein
MDRSEAVSAIHQALVNSGSIEEATELTADLDLIGDGIIDSLDAMMFLFELEKVLGHKVPTIDEAYDDFTVGALADAVVSDADRA